MKEMLIATWETIRLGFLVNFVAVVLIVAVLARFVWAIWERFRRAMRFR